MRSVNSGVVGFFSGVCKGTRSVNFCKRKHHCSGAECKSLEANAGTLQSLTATSGDPTEKHTIFQQKIKYNRKLFIHSAHGTAGFLFGRRSLRGSTVNFPLKKNCITLTIMQCFIFSLYGSRRVPLAHRPHWKTPPLPNLQTSQKNVKFQVRCIYAW